MFDEPTRLARYESMRKGPGRRASRHKQLYMLHMDLEKACSRSINRFERNTRIATADVERQKVLMLKKRGRISEQIQKFALRRERTHTLLDGFREQHALKQRSWSQIQEQVAGQTKRRAELSPFPFDVDYHYRSHEPLISGERTPQRRASPILATATNNLLAPPHASSLRFSAHSHARAHSPRLPPIGIASRGQTMAY